MQVSKVRKVIMLTWESAFLIINLVEGERSSAGLREGGAQGERRNEFHSLASL